MATLTVERRPSLTPCARLSARLPKAAALAETLLRGLPRDAEGSRDVGPRTRVRTHAELGDGGVQLVVDVVA
jgi:hypothetical protein